MDINENMINNYFMFDLQLFSGEKTEQPTPRKKSEARKKGQVPQSREINTAIVLIVAFVSLRIYAPKLLLSMRDLFYKSYSGLADHNVEGTIGGLTIYVCTALLSAVLPILIIVALTGVLINFLQIGPMFSLGNLQPKFSKINPLEGVKRIFSKRTVAELFKSIFKISVIIYMLYSTIKNQYQIFPQMMDMDILESISSLAMLTFNVVMRVAILLLILALADLFFQRWQFTQDLKMSKQEVKDEYKQMEGDPQIKSKIKQKQRQLAMSRMMHKVPQADVVITNPTHLAVALQYVSEQMGAPVVIAKGQDKVAERIKSIARENGIAIVENKPLAQALYRTTEINQVIPLELYQAVAEVLAFVYKLKKKRSVS